MATKYWMVTTQSKGKKPTGELDTSTFTDTTDTHPIEFLAGCRQRQPDRYWSLMFALPITAAQAKKFAQTGGT